MFYIKGVVKEVNHKYIIVEANHIGYKIFANDCLSYEIDKSYLLYLHEHINDSDSYLIGFNNVDYYNVFKLLIKINGIGPKSILAIFTKVTLQELISFCKNENIMSLCNLPYINKQQAVKVISIINNYCQSGDLLENLTKVERTLLSLGYDKNKIRKVLTSLDENIPESDLFKLALRSLNSI